MDHSTVEEASSTAYITTKYLEGIHCKECKKEFVKMITDKTSQFKPSSSCRLGTVRHCVEQHIVVLALDLQ
jgi:hypothetical protein